MPRFEPERSANVALVEELKAIAKSENCSAAQLALAWVLARGDHIVPIAGTSKPQRLEENAGAATLRLTEKTMQALERLFPPGVMAGARNRAGLLSRMGI